MPEEMPLSASENVAYRNHLIHRQNPSGNTILHRLVEEGTNKQLQSFLDAAKEVYPIANRDHQTPLHLAIKRSDHTKAEMLLDKYLKRAAISLCSLCSALGWDIDKDKDINMSSRFPDLSAKLLAGSKKKVDTSSIPRLEVKHIQYKASSHVIPVIKRIFSDTSLWSSSDAQKGGKEVAVTPYLIGFPGFLAQDGPFDAIVRSKNLKAFETDAMKYAVDYKWKTYGRSLQLFFVSLYLTMFIFFTVGQVAYTTETTYLPWLVIASSIAGIFLIEEAVQMVNNVSEYLSSGWNILDILVYIMVITSAILCPR